LENSTYIDDTLFGGDDISDLRETREQLITLMKGGISIAEVGREFVNTFGRYSPKVSLRIMLFRTMKR